MYCENYIIINASFSENIFDGLNFMRTYCNEKKLKYTLLSIAVSVYRLIFLSSLAVISRARSLKYFKKAIVVNFLFNKSDTVVKKSHKRA